MGREGGMEGGRKGGGFRMVRGTELHRGIIRYKCLSNHVFSRRCHVSYELSCI